MAITTVKIHTVHRSDQSDSAYVPDQQGVCSQNTKDNFCVHGVEILGYIGLHRYMIQLLDCNNDVQATIVHIMCIGMFKMH